MLLLALRVFTGTGSFIGTAAIGFGKIGAAGGLVGVILGLVAILWVRKVFNDPLIEITVVLVTSYAVFFVCEHFFPCVWGSWTWLHLGLLWQVLEEPESVQKLNILCTNFGSLLHLLANVIIFIVVGVVIAQNAHPTGMDFSDLRFGLRCDSFGSCNQYGNVLPVNEKSGLWSAREGRSRGMVGCIKRGHWFGTGFGCLL